MSASTTGRDGWADWSKLRAGLAVAWPCLLHGLRICAAVTLALFVAYELELDNAYWAGATAAVVCQPSLGASLRKGWYRTVGTFVGAVTILLLVAAFPQQRIGMLVGLALFTGLCGFFAATLRNYVAYGAVLAGVTAAVVFADFIASADQSFHYAVTRGSEIFIGSLCAGAVLIVTNLGRARDRLASALADAAIGIAAGIARTLAIGPDSEKTRGVRREMIRRIIALDPIMDEATGEAPDLHYRTRTLQAGVEGLFSAISAWRGIANFLDTTWDEAAQDDAAALLPAVMSVRNGDWWGDPEAMRAACGNAARRVLAMPAGTASTRFLIDHVADALLALQRAANGLVLVSAPGRETLDTEAKDLPVPDILPPLMNALRIVLLVLATEFVWVETNWSGGQTMVEFAALVALVFSPQTDDAYPNVVGFAVGATICVLVAAVADFVVLPAQHSFLGLSLTIGCVLVPCGAFAAWRWHKQMFAGIVLLFVVLMAPENQQSYDTGKFLNTGLEIIAATIAAAISLRLIPPISPPWRASRLLALTLR
ncbi:MAG TPA: FUSC family protein, partial [Acetobacteraceae bacterium]